jgi:anti-sigma-K factor RskA
VAAAVVLGVDLASTRHQLTHAQQQLAQARAQGRTIQRELALSQAQARSFAVLLAAPDARILSHASTHGGTATLVVSIRQRQLVVTTAGLPALPSGKVYQLWMIGKIIYPAGFLPRSVAGRTTPVRATRVIAGDTFGVTVEPAGGTKQPTTTPIIAIPLPR